MKNRCQWEVIERKLSMKSKKVMIIGISIILFIVISSMIYGINQLYGNTSDSRQRILSKPGNNTIILSEIIIENYVISEFIDQKAGYGYALFEANQTGNYSLKNKMISTQQFEPIVTDIININDKLYEILMCYKSGLDYAELIYTDPISGEKLEPFRVEMDNKTVAFFEAPEYASYTRYVSFYDNKGKKFE